MRTFMTAALLLSLAATHVLAPIPAFAQDSAKVILDRHERTIKVALLNVAIEPLCPRRVGLDDQNANAVGRHVQGSYENARD